MLVDLIVPFKLVASITPSVFNSLMRIVLLSPCVTVNSSLNCEKFCLELSIMFTMKYQCCKVLVRYTTEKES